MTYPKQPKIIQFGTMVLHVICIVLGILCANADNNWNSNSYNVDRVALLQAKYKLSKPFNFEEELIIEKELPREYATQVAGLSIWGVMLGLAIIHCYLCFLLTYHYFRKYVNMYFHLAGAGVILVGAACYITSFIQNNEMYDRHFQILYENYPASSIPWHPCKFPQFETGFLSLFGGKPYECQETWTKFLVIVLSIFNIFLHLVMVFVIAFFVEEEDAAEMLYKEMEVVGGGALPPLSSLPPLPYYARPVAYSPTSKRRRKKNRRITFVEVPENWTTPKANLNAPSRSTVNDLGGSDSTYSAPTTPPAKKGYGSKKLKRVASK